MPFKSDRIKIAGTEHDRRRKLTAQDKADIRELVGLSINGIARMYGVSKRTIQFIKFPERLERNKLLRKQRGGEKIYYDRQKNAGYTRTHRRYKHSLFVENKIAIEK